MAFKALAAMFRRNVPRKYLRSWEHHCPVHGGLVITPNDRPCTYCRQDEIIFASRTNDDILAEAIRRRELGEVKPLWVDMTDAARREWIERAADARAFLRRHGLTVARLRQE